MYDATKRRDELIGHALLLTIEALNRLSTLCEEGELDDDLVALKEMVEEHKSRTGSAC